MMKQYLIALLAICSGLFHGALHADDDEDIRTIFQRGAFEPKQVVHHPKNDNQIFVQEGDGTIALYLITEDDQWIRFREFNATATTFAISPSGKVLAASRGDLSIQLWSTTNGKPIGQPLSGHTGSIYSIAFAPDGRSLASAGDDKTIRRWDVASGKPIGQPLSGHTGSIQSIAFSPDGLSLASAGADQTIRRWDVASGKPIGQPLTGHTGSIRSIAFAPDGRSLASAGMDKTIRRWDVASGKPIGQPLTGHTRWIQSIAFSPDGRSLASAGDDNTIRRWDVASGKPIGQPLTRHTGSIYSIAFSPDGLSLASAGDDKTIRRWDVASRKPIGQPLTGHTGSIYSIAFAPDGRLLASASRDRTIRRWDVASGKPIGQPLTGHTNWIRSIAFSPDGRSLVSAGDDKTIRRWDVTSGKPIGQPLTGHTDWIRSIAFSPDGRSLASAGDDKAIRRWDVASGKPIGPPIHTPYSQHINIIGHTLFASNATGIQTFNISDQQSNILGQTLLFDDQFIAISSSQHFSATERSRTKVFTFKGNKRLTGAKQAKYDNPEIALAQITNNYSLWLRFKAWATDKVAAAEAFYTAQPTWLKPIIIAWLFWLLLIVPLGVLWLIRPHLLAHWAMPRSDTPSWPFKIGNWLTLIHWLGHTERALNAWLKRNNQALNKATFLGKDSVKERSSYVALGADNHVNTIVGQLPKKPKKTEVHYWLQGKGGSGKSALCYAIAKSALAKRPKNLWVIVFNEDWSGSPMQQIQSHVLKLKQRQPSEKMLKKLLSRGYIMLIFDAVSERGNEAETQIKTMLNDGLAPIMLATSRHEKPSIDSWGSVEQITPGKLDESNLETFIGAYTEEDKLTEEQIHSLLGTLQGLLANDKEQGNSEQKTITPLFARMVIKAVADGQVVAEQRPELILNYVRGLQAGDNALSEDELLRVSKLLAFYNVQEHLGPSERSYNETLGLIDARVYIAHNDEELNARQILKQLVAAGILQQESGAQGRIQFQYDPVAEYLALIFAFENKDTKEETLDKKLSSFFRRVSHPKNDCDNLRSVRDEVKEYLKL